MNGWLGVGVGVGVLVLAAAVVVAVIVARHAVDWIGAPIVVGVLTLTSFVIVTPGQTSVVQFVEGACGMVELALEWLTAGGVVELDEERTASMVSNLMVVLCGDQPASPVVNTHSLST